MKKITKIIALLDGDYKRGTNLFNTEKRFPNLVLMKISAYYKQKGYKIEWYYPIFHNKYNKIFVSKVFSWRSPMQNYFRKDMIIGGSGWDLEKKLSHKIEHIYPDYSLYEINYAMGFITRGCIRNCPYCIVPKKEGSIRKNADIEEFWKNQKRILLLDNNFLAYKNHINELNKLIETECKIDFNQGLDIRLINHQNAKLLSKLKKWDGTDFRFAFDYPEMENIIKKKTKILREYGIRRGHFYVLIGFNTTPKQDFRRIQFLKELGHIPYIMPYNKRDPYQKAIRKFVNRHFYRVMDFKTYLENYASKEQKQYFRENKTLLLSIQSLYRNLTLMDYIEV